MSPVSLAWAGGLWKGETPQKEEGRVSTGVLDPVVGEKPRAPGSSPGWKGPAVPDREPWETAERVGRHAPGHSPPAQGAPLFPGSRSLQVSPEKGSTRQCQSDPHRSFLRPPFLAQAQVLALMRTPREAAPQGHMAVLSAGHCEGWSCHTSKVGKSRACLVSSRGPLPHSFLPGGTDGASSL